MAAQCYESMIHYPHHRSRTRPHMSRHGRAAQFAPFAALTGYDAAIAETARRTDARMELTEDARASLDVRMQLLQECIDTEPEVSVTYFVPDKRKAGGAYDTVSGTVRRIDMAEGLLIFRDGRRISLAEIVLLEGALFASVTDWGD